MTERSPWSGRAVSEILAASRFGIVGLAATGVHAGVALALAIPDILPPLLANTVAFLTAFIVSFAGHHTFGAFRKPRNRRGNGMRACRASFSSPFWALRSIPARLQAGLP